MSTHNRKTFNELRRKALGMGYKVRADRLRKHDVFVLIGPEGERTLMLSGSGYDANSRHKQNLLSDFKKLTQEIRPFSEIEEQNMETNGHEMPTLSAALREPPAAKPEPMPTPIVAQVARDVDHTVHPMKVFLKGSSLGISIERKSLRKFETDKASVELTADKKLILYFHDGGSEPGKLASEGFVAYYFKRSLVPFNFAQRLPRALGQQIGRVKGQSLVTNAPLPSEFFTGQLALGEEGRATSLEDATAIKNLLNQWLTWAREAGMEPRVLFDEEACAIDVTITERKERKL